MDGTPNEREKEFGIERLFAAFASWRTHPLRAGLDLAASTVRTWCNGRLKDDVSLLAVERLR